jgi:hypothetical protein
VSCLITGMAMQSGTNREGEKSVDAARLGALLDKLVAVQLDLEPICKVRQQDVPGAQTDAVAEACALLRTAIADLREIILKLTGPPSEGTR